MTTSLSDSRAVTDPGRKPGDPGLATGVRVVRPSHRATPIIDARAYSFWYGATQALFDLTFTIPRRAVTALIGPSGCGKSTFLRSVNRLNELIPGTRHSGDILLEGVSVFSRGMDAVALRREVGMVFQRPNPFPKTIFDNVAYGPRLNALAPERDIPERVERALRQAALWDEVKDRLDAPGTSLSGGQPPRLCIARALANEPDVPPMAGPCPARRSPRGTSTLSRRARRAQGKAPHHVGRSPRGAGARPRRAAQAGRRLRDPRDRGRSRHRRPRARDRGNRHRPARHPAAHGPRPAAARRRHQDRQRPRARRRPRREHRAVGRATAGRPHGRSRARAA